ncbi:MAG: DUF1587 domain-containing protein, partial [Verrucomicrobiae bacterium]|nr:DUF1587 domain-containing protein [Verrucomicrobiae bacterium]
MAGFRLLVVALAVACGMAPEFSGGQERAATYTTTLQPLIEAHCLDCHGPDSQKAGLRLDTLSTELSDAAALNRWVKVHDRLAAGDMPPAKRERPPVAMVEASVKSLHQSLHHASLKRQETQGRVLIRRLNATEYENTVRELVGTEVALKEIFPEENAAAGFDNVSAALDLSSTHLLLYQEAAEKAIASVIPKHPPLPLKERRTGREMSERGSNFRQTLTRSCKLEGDSLVIYSKLPRYGLACTPNVQGAGNYRIRLSAAAVGAAGTPVAAAYAVVGRGQEPPEVREMADFQPGKSQVIEKEVYLEAGEAFVVNLMANWDIRATKQPIEAYDGPGIRIDWMEIEGPIGSFPADSY